MGGGQCDSMRQIAFPFRIDSTGGTADPGYRRHVRDLIEQILFTTSGERVNRPDFGTGILQMVFAPNSSEVATATEFLIQGALQDWLSDVVQVEAVRVESDDATLSITVVYRLLRSQEQEVAEFVRQV
jgi:phage baseplate assembly protein W